MIVNQATKAGYVIIAILLAFIGLFIFSNTDTILGRMGFETKASVKAELSQAKERLDTVATKNEELTKQLETQTKAKEIVENELKELRKTRELVDGQIEFHKAQRQANAKAASAKLKATSVKTDKTYTFDIQAAQEVSKANIDALHAAYDGLFENT